MRFLLILFNNNNNNNNNGDNDGDNNGDNRCVFINELLFLYNFCSSRENKRKEER